MTDRDILTSLLRSSENHTKQVRQELLTVLRQTAADFTRAADTLEHTPDHGLGVQRLSSLSGRDARIERLVVQYGEALTHRQELRDRLIAVMERA